MNHAQTLEHYGQVLKEARRRKPFEAQCVVSLFGVPWRVSAEFHNAELDDVEVAIKPADGSDAAYYKIDPAELPVDVQEEIEFACTAEYSKLKEAHFDDE